MIGKARAHRGFQFNCVTGVHTGTRSPNIMTNRNYKFIEEREIGRIGKRYDGNSRIAIGLHLSFPCQIESEIAKSGQDQIFVAEHCCQAN